MLDFWILSKFKDSKRLSMNGMEKELNEGLQAAYRKTSKMADLRYIIVVQHPRQYALEVANERSELPDSELYKEVLREWVNVSTFKFKFSISEVPDHVTGNQRNISCRVMIHD